MKSVMLCRYNTPKSAQQQLKYMRETATYNEGGNFYHGWGNYIRTLLQESLGRDCLQEAHNYTF